MNKRFFTLVELLVVISIIAILASMLLPALQRAKYKAKVTQCVGTLKGVSRAILIYTADYDQYYPEVYPAYTGNGNWFAAKQVHREKSWEFYSRNLGAASGDLRPIYREYLGAELDQVMKCAFPTKSFQGKIGQSSNYTLYPTSNYRSKHFSYKDVGGFQKAGTSFRSKETPEYEFGILASDVAFGSLSSRVISGHPSQAGAIGEYNSNTNDHSGWILGPNNVAGFRAPVNYANDDGSVRTYQIDSNAWNDSQNWARHGDKAFLLPIDLAR